MNTADPSLVSLVQLGVMLVGMAVRVLLWGLVGGLGARISAGGSRTWFLATAVVGGLLAIAVPPINMALTMVVSRSLGPDMLMGFFTLSNAVFSMVSWLPFVLLIIALVRLHADRRAEARP